MNIIIRTKDFMYNFAQKELESFDVNPIYFDNEFLKVEINDVEKLKKLVSNIFYYSRSIKEVFLEISSFDKIENLDSKFDLDFIKKEFSFEVDSHTKDRDLEEREIGKIILNSNSNLRVDLKKPDLCFRVLEIDSKKYLGLDLIGFDLTKREYKININSNSINSIVCNYLFYLMELDKEKKPLSIIDPVCSLGDLIIESSFFNPKIPLNIKKKNIIVFSKVFSNISLPKIEDKSKLKLIGVVQNNKVFKQLKENITHSSQKIKTSQYELDFLDVKFHRGDNNYLICNLPMFKDAKENEEFLKEFFYQAEFIVKKKIGIISKKEINEKTFKKYKLWAKIKKQILVGEQKYFIYIITK